MATLEERRADLLGAIPAWYSGWAHLALINACVLGFVALCLARLSSPGALELAAVPGFVVFANVFEWWVHRGPLHHRTRLLGALYRRHARTHHVVFTDDRMAIRGARELKLVLFPSFVMPLLLLLTAPLWLGLFLVAPNLGWLFLASSCGYYLLYEWLHTLHHLPRDGWLGRRRWVVALGRHHARHHDPALMTRGNFNVSFPLADWLLRSTLPEASPARAAAERP